MFLQRWASSRLHNPAASLRGRVEEWGWSRPTSASRLSVMFRWLPFKAFPYRLPQGNCCFRTAGLLACRLARSRHPRPRPSLLGHARLHVDLGAGDPELASPSPQSCMGPRPGMKITYPYLLGLESQSLLILSNTPVKRYKSPKG